MSYFYGTTSNAATPGNHTSNQSSLKRDGDEFYKSTQPDKAEFIISGEKQSICSVNDENDYIRTAIVTNANDKFMSAISLCLICGSVGKDVEGTMISCTSCAQSYHTYCVGMHDKVTFLITI